MAKKSKLDRLCCCCSPWAWGVFFLIWGCFLLAKELGLVSINFPFWPLLLIMFGLYLLKKKYKK